MWKNCQYRVCTGGSVLQLNQTVRVLLLLSRQTSGKKGLSSSLRRGGGNSNVKGSGVKSGSKILSYSSHKNQGGYGDYWC